MYRIFSIEFYVLQNTIKIKIVAERYIYKIVVAVYAAVSTVPLRY